MPIILEAAYSKKLGLPNYSSHSYVVSIRTELADINNVPEESSRLYRMLQDAVDREIQEVGFLPDATQYGMNGGESGSGSNPTNGNSPANGNGQHSNGSRNSGNGHADNHSNGNTNHQTNGNHRNNNGHGVPITPRQLDLINNLVRDKNLDKNEVEQTAIQMFGVGVKQLNKMQASNLIDELFETHGGRNGGDQRRSFQRERSR